MFISFSKYEKAAKKNYDDIREYCLAEQVDEEFLRYSIRKKRRKKPMKREVIIWVAIIGLFIITALSIHIEMMSEMNSIKYHEEN